MAFDPHVALSDISHRQHYVRRSLRLGWRLIIVRCLLITTLYVSLDIPHRAVAAALFVSSVLGGLFMIAASLKYSWSWVLGIKSHPHRTKMTRWQYVVIATAGGLLGISYNAVWLVAQHAGLEHPYLYGALGVAATVLLIDTQLRPLMVRWWGRHDSI